MDHHSTVTTNAHLENLEHLPYIPNSPRDIKLMTLGNLHTAPAMYQVLYSLIRDRNWTCHQQDALRGYSFLAGWLERIRGVLGGLLPANNANLVLHGDDSVLHVFTRLIQEAIQLRNAKKDIGIKGLLLKTEVKNVSDVISGQVGQVLSGGMDTAHFQTRIPGMIAEIDHLLIAQMRF